MPSTLCGPPIHGAHQGRTGADAGAQRIDTALECGGDFLPKRPLALPHQSWVTGWCLTRCPLGCPELIGMEGAWLGRQGVGPVLRALDQAGVGFKRRIYDTRQVRGTAGANARCRWRGA